MCSHAHRMFCVAVLALWVGATAVAAPPGDKPASPRSLPTDELPPFGMLDDSGTLIPVPALPAPPPGASSAARGPQPPAPTGLGIDLAIAGARAALASCLAQGVRIAVAVVDADGKPRALLMQEGSEGSVFVAMRKAQATLAFRLPSSQIGARLKEDPAAMAKFSPVMFLSGGALPIFAADELLGAIASSGAHGAGPIGAQDEICARAGLRRITAALAAAHR